MSRYGKDENDLPKLYASITGSDGNWVIGYLYLKSKRERVTPEDKLPRFQTERADSVRHIIEEIMDEVYSTVQMESKGESSVLASVDFDFDVDGERSKNTFYLCYCGGFAVKGGCNRCGAKLN